MKRLIVALTAVAMVGGAYADIYANLSAGFGISGNGSAGGIVNPIDGTAVELLVIAGGGDGLDYLGGSGVAGSDPYEVPASGVAGNDVLLATLSAVVTSGGADYSDWAGTISGDVTVIPHVGDTWIRVSGVQAGDWVYEQAQPFADLDSSDPLQLPEVVFFDNGGTGGAADGSVVVIPEPGTIGLMGLAGLGIYLARCKTRR